MDLVRKLRQKKGWSQEHLADAAGLARATVQRIESGQVVPNTETSLALAAALGADAEKIREAAGLAAQVFRVMEITHTRDANDGELADLPLSIRETLLKFYAARAELEAAREAMKAADAAWQVIAMEKDQVANECSSLLRHLLDSPDDPDAYRAFSEGVARMKSVHGRPVPLGADVTAACREAQLALMRFNDACLEVIRLMMRFA